jgi:predicted anti-sigma-YlaC factor YlaD
MKCKDVNAKLSAYLDNQTHGAQRLTIEQHVAQCKTCSNLLERLTNLNEQLRNSVPGPNPGLTNRIKDAVFGREEKTKPRLVPVWLQAPMFALALLVAIGIGNMMGTSLTKIVAADRTEITLDQLTPNLEPTITDALLGIKDM